MSAVLNLNTFTPTISNPQNISNWGKGKKTTTYRNDLNASQRNIMQIKSAQENVSRFLGNTPSHQRWKINYNFQENIIEQNEYWKKNNSSFDINSEKGKKISTAFYPSETWPEILELLAGSRNQSVLGDDLLNDYVEAFRAAIFSEPTLDLFSDEARNTSVTLCYDSERKYAEDFQNQKACNITIIPSAKEQQVIDALVDSRWDFRTIRGIAKEKKLNSKFVEDVLIKHHNLVRRCKVPNHNGEALFTLSSKQETLREKIALWLIFIKKSV